MKEIAFVAGAGEDLRAFPEAARQRAGYQLYRVQSGDEPTDWKPMTSIGPGCREIRVRDEASNAYRVVYVANVGDVVYVLHCFQKTTQRTAKSDVDLARARYRAVLATMERKAP